MIDLVIAVPTAGTVKMGFAYSLAGLVTGIAAFGFHQSRRKHLNIRTTELFKILLRNYDWMTSFILID